MELTFTNYVKKNIIIIYNVGFFRKLFEPFGQNFLRIFLRNICLFLGIIGCFFIYKCCLFIEKFVYNKKNKGTHF
jgi:hypothetical protein